MQAANLPSQEGLNSLYGDWNPMAYMQGMQNQDIASQFRQQGFQSNANDLDKQSLENQQAALMNPELLAKQRYANVEAGLTAERNVAQRQNNLDADDRAAVLKMSADEFAKFGNDATRLAISSNPAEQKHGQELLALLPAAQAERRKAADAMALQQEQTRAHLSGIGMQGQNLRDVEQMRIDAGKYDKASKASSSISGIQSLVQQGKMTFEKAATAFHGAAMFEPDPELAKKYEDLASQYEQLDRNKALAGKEGSVNVPAVANMPSVKTPTVIKGAGTADNPIVLK